MSGAGLTGTRLTNIKMAAPALFLAAILAIVSLSPAAAKLPWSYTGATRPRYWASLKNPSTGELLYPFCSGRSQSPINLVNTPASASPFPLEVSGNCNTVELTFREEEYLWAYVGANNCTTTSSLSGKPMDYKLVQLHVHSPAEHRLDNELHAAEIHFVHVSASGGLLVIGVILEAAFGIPENAWIGKAFKHISDLSEPGSSDAVRHEIMNPVELNPAWDGFFQYSGSLTQPPCLEPVQWWVAASTVKVPASQLYALTKQQKLAKALLHGANNRPVQPLNGRVVTRYNV